MRCREEYEMYFYNYRRAASDSIRQAINWTLKILTQAFLLCIYTQYTTTEKHSTFYSTYAGLISRRVQIISFEVSSKDNFISLHLSAQRGSNDLWRIRLSRGRIWFGSTPIPRQQLASLSQSSCVSPVQVTGGRGRRAVGLEPNHMTARKLDFYKSFNTLCLSPSPPPPTRKLLNNMNMAPVC
jgi:hypothetical protein